MKRALVVLLPLVLGGCGAVSVAGIAYYTLEGATYAASGRTMSDHVISAMMEKDCVVYRVVKGEVVCREFTPGDETFLVALVKTWKRDVASTFAVAEIDSGEKTDATPALQAASADTAAAAAVAVEPAAGTGAADSMPEDAKTIVVDQLALSDPVMVPSAMSDIVPGLEGAVAVEPAAGPSPATSFAPGSADQLAAAVDTAPTLAPAEKLDPANSDGGWQPVVSATASTGYIARTGAEEILVLGSFADRRNAVQEASAWPAFEPRIVPALVNGKTWYRVVAGPYVREVIEQRRSQAWSRGLRDVWSTKLCTPGTSRARCIVMPTS